MTDRTPVSPAKLRRYDHLPAAEAASRAWAKPGVNPEWHREMRQRVRDAMPLLARALDRLERDV